MTTYICSLNLCVCIYYQSYKHNATQQPPGWTWRSSLQKGGQPSQCDKFGQFQVGRLRVSRYPPQSKVIFSRGGGLFGVVVLGFCRIFPFPILSAQISLSWVAYFACLPWWVLRFGDIIVFFPLCTDILCSFDFSRVDRVDIWWPCDVTGVFRKRQ